MKNITNSLREQWENAKEQFSGLARQNISKIGAVLAFGVLGGALFLDDTDAKEKRYPQVETKDGRVMAEIPMEFNTPRAILEYDSNGKQIGAYLTEGARPIYVDEKTGTYYRLNENTYTVLSNTGAFEEDTSRNFGYGSDSLSRALRWRFVKDLPEAERLLKLEKASKKTAGAMK